MAVKMVVWMAEMTVAWRVVMMVDKKGATTAGLRAD